MVSNKRRYAVGEVIPLVVRRCTTDESDYTGTPRYNPQAVRALVEASKSPNNETLRDQIKRLLGDAYDLATTAATDHTVVHISEAYAMVRSFRDEGIVLFLSITDAAQKPGLVAALTRERERRIKEGVWCPKPTARDS